MAALAQVVLQGSSVGVIVTPARLARLGGQGAPFCGVLAVGQREHEVAVRLLEHRDAIVDDRDLLLRHAARDQHRFDEIRDRQ